METSLSTRPRRRRGGYQPPMVDPTPAQIRERCREVRILRHTVSSPETERADRVLSAIRQHGPATKTRLLAVLSGIGHHSLNTALARLVTEGVIEEVSFAQRTVTSRYLYQVPNDGDGVDDLPSPRAIIESFRDRARRHAAA